MSARCCATSPICASVLRRASLRPVPQYILCVWRLLRYLLPLGFLQARISLGIDWRVDFHHGRGEAQFSGLHYSFESFNHREVKLASRDFADNSESLIDFHS